MTYEEYLDDFDPSPDEQWQGYKSPLSRDEWEEENEDNPKVD